MSADKPLKSFLVFHQSVIFAEHTVKTTEDSIYFRFCRTYSQNCSILTFQGKSSHRQYLNKWVCKLYLQRKVDCQILPEDCSLLTCAFEKQSASITMETNPHRQLPNPHQQLPNPHHFICHRNFSFQKCALVTKVWKQLAQRNQLPFHSSVE